MAKKTQPAGKSLYLSCRADQETLDSVEQLAAELERTKSDIVRRAIKRYKLYIERRRQKRLAEIPPSQRRKGKTS